MTCISSAHAAKKWGISKRSVKSVYGEILNNLIDRRYAILYKNIEKQAKLQLKKPVEYQSLSAKRRCRMKRSAGLFLCR